MDELPATMVESVVDTIGEPAGDVAPLLLAMLLSVSVRALLIWDSWRIGP
jgi:hypothetical protein